MTNRSTPSKLRDILFVARSPEQGVFGGTSLLEISNNFYSTIIQQLKSDSRALAMHVCSRWIFLAPKWSKNLLCCPWNGPRKVYSDRTLSLLPLLTTSVLRQYFSCQLLRTRCSAFSKIRKWSVRPEAWSKNAKSLRPARVSINKKKLAPKQSTRQTFFCALFNFVMANAELLSYANWLIERLLRRKYSLRKSECVTAADSWACDNQKHNQCKVH